jgi:polar amino acid transport system permease protein
MVAASGWSASARQVEREALRRRMRLRSATVATVATLLVLGLLTVVIATSPGWPRVQETFFSWEHAKASFPDVLKGFGKNVLLFLIAEPLILVVGALVAVVRSTTAPALLPARLLAIFYTDLFRGVPTLLVVILAGFGIPALQLRGVTNNTFWLGLGALVASYGAYVAEVFRAGIDSIHPSQVASADALGLSHAQTMRYVVLPQATRRVVPPLLNDFISLQKDTALLSSIFVFEGLFTAQDYAAFNFNYTPIVVVAVLFVALTIPLARFTDWMGRRMMRRERAGAR